MSGPQYDGQPDETHPPRYLLLCTTPRTGSHRLCRAMYELGLGVPTEYLHPWAFVTMAPRFSPGVDPETSEGFAAYWQQVCRYRQRGGLVAASVFGYQIAQVKAIIGDRDGDLFIHLFRRNRGEQVASLMALYQTKMPYEGEARISGIPDISEISPRSIRIVDQFLRAQNRRWRAYLADKPHLAIASEDFFADPEAVLERIAVHCGFAPNSLPIAEAARAIEGTSAYTANRNAKQKILADFPDAFAALDRAAEDAI